MSKHVVWLWWGLLVLALSLAGCQTQKPDMEATIDALNATVAAQEQELVTLEAEANQPTPSPPPSPTNIPTHQPAVALPTVALPAVALPTVALPTPRPATTIQRPPTITPTFTPLPTATATATATPVPDAAVGDAVANLRSGPSVGYGILAEVESGTPLEVLGKSADNEWLKVRTPAGLEGWMFHLPVRLNIPLDSVPVTE